MYERNTKPINIRAKRHSTMSFLGSRSGLENNRVDEKCDIHRINVQRHKFYVKFSFPLIPITEMT
jgi:hypothetical protein